VGQSFSKKAETETGAGRVTARLLRQSTNGRLLTGVVTSNLDVTGISREVFVRIGQLGRNHPPHAPRPHQPATHPARRSPQVTEPVSGPRGSTEFPFPLPGLGIDMVWNPRLTDQYFIEWLRGLLFEITTHL
jgi:hypothetical protein